MVFKKVTAVVEREKCHPHKCQHECIKYDPLNRKTPDSGFHLGQHGKAEINEEVVTEMHKVSANRCPFHAIRIIKLPDRLKEESLLHAYGKNQFELFGLPSIKKGEIVGVIGRNGIGKSTALRILSGNIIPNLGKYEEEPNTEKIIEKYSNTHLGEYFKDLYAKKLKVAYKPQRVELLSKLYSGKVNELLKKHDEKGIVGEIVKFLEIEHLVEKNVEELSGGELQKIAIVAAFAKKSDVIYLDEPASFLDITSRIKMAKMIRKFKGKAAVVVIEHDLATLDYISDEIQIVYGEAAAFGVFSQSKGVRRGVNDYLEGFLPDDNVRFRKYAITFQKPLEKFKTEKRTVFSFPELRKSYPGFTLKVNKGELKAGEVLTIMGANGLGKTTLLKLLAGEEKPDSGKVEPTKISFKPQYVELPEGKVREYLMKVAGSSYTSGWYQQHLLEKLNIQTVLESEMKTLSGGEMQKVAIAVALSTDAKIIALDEPSAFVDVEDRLHVAEVIKEFTEKKGVATLVVDHDVQFLDYLGDSMIIFEGTPGIEGKMFGPCSKEDGMNKVLKMLEITYRKDKDTNRARINKPGSQLDQEQRRKQQYYVN